MKYSLLFGLLFSTLLLTGCTQPPVEPMPKNDQSIQDNLETTYSPITPVVSTETLPPDIHPAQVRMTGDDYFVKAVKPSVHFPLKDIPEDFQANFRGILQWDDQIGKWKKFLIVQDAPGKESSENNPIKFWWEGPDGTDKVPHLQVLDINGGGSGEGISKEFVAENIGLDTWKMTSCFYYALDRGWIRDVSVSEEDCQNAEVTLVQ